MWSGYSPFHCASAAQSVSVRHVFYSNQKAICPRQAVFTAVKCRKSVFMRSTWGQKISASGHHAFVRLENVWGTERCGEMCDFRLLEQQQCNHLARTDLDSAAEAVWSNFMVLFVFILTLTYLTYYCTS